MDRYEDFDAWKLTRALNMKVFELTSAPPASKDFKFRDNLRNAADSAERNFPEGFGRFAPGDFARFLDNSKASLLETRNELGVGLARGYFSDQDVRELTALVDRAMGAIGGLQRYLRSEKGRANAKRIRERLAREPTREKKARTTTDEPRNDEPRNDEPTN